MRLMLNILCSKFVIMKDVEEPEMKYVASVLRLAAYSEADL
jgi:hypothetical protein